MFTLNTQVCGFGEGSTHKQHAEMRQGNRQASSRDFTAAKTRRNTWKNVLSLEEAKRGGRTDLYLEHILLAHS
jgi:hypothetical protein